MHFFLFLFKLDIITAQRDAGRRIGERITDVTFWRNELNTEHEKLVSETQLLSDMKRNVAKALQVSFLCFFFYLNIFGTPWSLEPKHEYKVLKVPVK